MAADGVAAAERRRPFAASWPARAGWLALAAYVAYVLATFEFDWARFVTGLDNAAALIGKLLPPETSDASKLSLLAKGLGESLEIAVLASALGILLSLPVGLAAARNLVPSYVSWAARALIVLCRSFHPVIVAILFVKA
ncbi:MAG: phosphonate ABC transporter, permease protein PhnE, partial [Rhodospirillaceae bacterium]|nr:phosphonate ABC transporter, permease protein PhnE [Rhodospirillaceae bacterium]